MGSDGRFCLMAAAETAIFQKGDEDFNAVYDRARKRYFSLLRGASVSLELAGQIPIAEPASPGEPGETP